MTISLFSFCWSSWRIGIKSFLGVRSLIVILLDCRFFLGFLSATSSDEPPFQLVVSSGRMTDISVLYFSLGIQFQEGILRGSGCHDHWVSAFLFCSSSKALPVCFLLQSARAFSLAIWLFRRVLGIIVVLFLNGLGKIGELTNITPFLCPYL